jgi:pyridoxamine 5'-phosphate oxidase
LEEPDLDKKEILSFITTNNIGYLATTEGKAPRVRGMDTFRADENGLIFYTDKSKNVCKQMVKNPEVEICYYARGIQIRVRGRVEMLEDLALKKEIVAKRPFYGEMSEEDYNDMAVFRLKGKATTWTMQDGDNPAGFINL